MRIFYIHLNIKSRLYPNKRETKEDLEKKREEYEKTGEILVGGGAVVREVPLNQMNLPENTPKTLSPGLITGVSSIFVAFFALVFVAVRKYRIKTE